MWSQFLGPLDQHHPIHSFLHPELADLLRILDAIEVEMPDLEPFGFVSLHQRIGRAGNFGVLASQRPDQRARQRRLARAEVAIQRDHVARPAGWREAFAERNGCRFIGQRNLDR